jgi:homoserine dehydrogenase
MFEASVGGGIPLIRPLIFCLAGNEVQSINGILNGTTNFILTKMIYENLTFEEALKIAQDNGYAEKDPTADVEGIDACRKISILSSLASNSWIDPEKVHTEGITHITLEDVAYAGNCECVIKLISTMEKLDDGRYYIVVSPAIVSKESQLAAIDGVFNGALVSGDNVGDVVFYGQGAGKLATASAVVGDIVDCANHDANRRKIGWNEENKDLVADYREVPNRYYIRLKVEDPDLAQNEIRSSFGDIYLLARSGAFNTELAFLTSEFTENEVREKIDGLTSAKLKSFIRVARC